MQIDEEALFNFDGYFRGHAGRVHAYLLRRADADCAQDATAETFLIAWRRRSEMPAEPLPWLYGIARGVLANELRAANRRAALASRIAAQPPAWSPGVGGDHEILEELAELRENDREAQLLCAWEGLSTREAATVLGCSAAAFAVRLHRARGRLARVLQQTGAETELTPASDAVPEVPR